MITLTDFLLARIAEDERDATLLRDDLAAQIRESGFGSDERGPFTPQRQLAAELWAHYAGQSRWRNFARGQYIARLASPDRVLAECEAKRRIVAAWPDPFGQWTAGQADAARAQKDATLRALALPYAEHPDYREEWRA